MYTLYIANRNYSSWSLRPWLLMRMLRIPFTEALRPFGSARFDEFSPSGKVPCLVDGELAVWDSLAITEYLAERHPGVWPVDPVARAYARSAAAEMHSGFMALRSECSMSCGHRVRLHAPSAALRNDLDRLDALWGTGLTRFGGSFLAGSAFGAVDAFFGPVAFRIQSYGLELAAPAAIYAERLLALEPMRDWYEAALAEPWREGGHEQEIAAAGVVTADLRTA